MLRQALSNTTSGSQSDTEGTACCCILSDLQSGSHMALTSVTMDSHVAGAKVWDLLNDLLTHGKYISS